MKKYLFKLDRFLNLEIEANNYVEAAIHFYEFTGRRIAVLVSVTK